MLFGATDHILEQTAAGLALPDRVEYDEALATSRARLPAHRFERYWRHGYELPNARVKERVAQLADSIASG